MSSTPSTDPQPAVERLAMTLPRLAEKRRLGEPIVIRRIDVAQGHRRPYVRRDGKAMVRMG